MTNFADTYRVESGRKFGWDYSKSGVYFITICALNKGKLFGKIIDGEMVLNKRGEIAKEQILKTIEIRKNININAWVVMPNHVGNEKFVTFLKDKGWEWGGDWDEIKDYMHFEKSLI